MSLNSYETACIDDRIDSIRVIRAFSLKTFGFDFGFFHVSNLVDKVQQERRDLKVREDVTKAIALLVSQGYKIEREKGPYA
jgi:hypothetical protein